WTDAVYCCRVISFILVIFFFQATAPTAIYTLSLHDALPIYIPDGTHSGVEPIPEKFELLKAKFKLNKNINLHNFAAGSKEEESKIGRAPSELQSRENLVCRLLLEKKKI